MLTCHNLQICVILLEGNGLVYKACAEKPKFYLGSLPLPIFFLSLYYLVQCPSPARCPGTWTLPHRWSRRRCSWCGCTGRDRCWRGWICHPQIGSWPRCPSNSWSALKDHKVPIIHRFLGIRPKLLTFAEGHLAEAKAKSCQGPNR